MLDVLSLAPEPLVPDSPVLFMVSGGSDSTALLLRAIEGSTRLEGDVAPLNARRPSFCVLHVNHCLRGADADADEAFVRELCERLGVSVYVTRADVGRLSRESGRNVEEVAREVRYRAAWDLLSEQARAHGVDPRCGRVLVAHTADDRAETFVMRLMHGAGVSGLAGMRRTCGLVERPLIDETRADLRRFLNSRGQSWREDKTNHENALDRSYVRNRVLPAIVERKPAFARTLARTVDVLSCEDDYLESQAREAYGLVAARWPQGSVSLGVRDLCDMHTAVARRVVRLALQDVLGEQAVRAARLELSHIDAVLDLAREGRGSLRLPLDTDIRVARAQVVLTPASSAGCMPKDDVELLPNRCVRWGAFEVGARGVEFDPKVFGATSFDDAVRPPCDCRASLSMRRGIPFARGLDEARGDGQVPRGFEAPVLGRDWCVIDADVAQAGGLWVGPPRKGERMVPFGSDAPKLVLDVLADAGIPAHMRSWVPIVRVGAVAEDARVVWACGARADVRAACGPDTESALALWVTEPLVCGA